MKIDQQLLLACAAYLAHERAYDFSALARGLGLAPAVGPLEAVGQEVARRLSVDEGRYEPEDDPYSAELLVLYHINAIRVRGTRRGRGGTPAGCEALAKAILEAAREPHMIAWWCATLQAESEDRGD